MPGAGGRALSPRRAVVGFRRRAAAVPQRLHDLLLGGGHLVDSSALHPRLLAARPEALPAALRPAVLGHGLPAWDVHGLHLPTLEGDQLRAADDSPALLHLPRAGGVARGLRRTHPRDLFRSSPRLMHHAAAVL